jgi:MFS family permease
MQSDDKDLEISHAENLHHLSIGADGNDLAPRGDPTAASRKLGIDVVDAVLDRVAEDDVMAISQSCLQLRSRTGLRLVGILFVMGINQAAYGVDWAVIGNINAYDTWHDYFGFGNTGAILATINSLMLIGSVCGAPFLVLSDIFGRRSVNFAGNACSIVAAIMQSQAPNLPVFMVGRFILGFGTALCTSSQYMAEISPVHLRGRFVGIFGACFQIGSVLMGGAMVAFSRWSTSNWQWRLPLLLQAVGPLIVCSTIYFLCPETPRYLVMKGRLDEARAVIAKTMTTNNDINSPIVGIVFRQIEESLESASRGTKTLRSSWDFRVFFTKRVAFRTMVIVVYSCFQSWNGGGIIGTYLAPALETVGITDPLSQTGISLGTTATYFVFTAIGAYLVDKMRRRTLIFAGLVSCILTQTAVTITSWQYTSKGTSAAAGLTVFWVFLFQALSAMFIATMHNLYPVEVLSLPLRAKGMAFYSIVQSAAGVVQQYGIS